MKIIKNECEQVPEIECMNDEDILNDIMLCEKNIYNLMFSKGWYSITQEDEKNIEKSYTKYSNKLSELS